MVNSKALIFVLFLVGLIYIPAINAPFQLDDYVTIVDNSVILSLKHIAKIWYVDPSRFLVHLTFAINHAIGGMGTFGYHLVNIVLHGLNGILIFILLKKIIPLAAPHRLQEKAHVIALGVTLLFLIHPIQTSAVTYTAQRSTLMMAFFYLSALYMYLKFRLEEDKRAYVVSLTAMALGVFCKPNFITLPFSIVLLETLVLPRSFFKFKRDIKIIAPYFLVILFIPVLLSLWKFKAFGIDQVLNMTRETEAISRRSYMFTQIHVLAHYFKLIVIPIGQNLDYDFPLQKSFLNISTIIKFTGLVVLFLSGLLNINRNRLYAFGVLWMFVTLSIESSIFPIADVIFEHRMYLPMFGVAIIIVPLFLSVLEKVKQKYIIIGLLVTILCSLTVYRNWIWADRMRLLTDNLVKSPNKARVHNRIGHAYYEAKDHKKAYDHFTQAIALDPQYPDAYVNRGRIFQDYNQLEKALNDYNAAIEALPMFYQALNNRANLLVLMDQPEWALKDFDRAIATNIYFYEAYINRGMVKANSGHYQAALDDLNYAISLNEYSAEAYNNRGLVHVRLKDFKAAYEDFNKALNLKPSLVGIERNRDNVLKILKSSN